MGCGPGHVETSGKGFVKVLTGLRGSILLELEDKEEANILEEVDFSTKALAEDVVVNSGVISNGNMEQDKLSILVKVEGSWTQKLYKEISSSVDHLQVSVEGPYGPTSSHFLRHESPVMVSGGSGIAPFISIIREIIFQTTQPNSQVPNIHLICVFKNFTDLSMLDLLLPLYDPPAEISKLKLQIDVYVTKETRQPETSENSPKLIKSVWFKPDPSDSPISPAGQLAMTLFNNNFIVSHVSSASGDHYTILYTKALKCIIFPTNVSGTCFLYVFVFSWLLVQFFSLKEETERHGRKASAELRGFDPGSWFCSEGDRELETLPSVSCSSHQCVFLRKT
ncbi:hypothetical protein Dsin_014408 [Dipteronia sinensis]|uniref:ferric-chelate reductase (NADH) n=1 Tax=Dipteronia sinensis TaxID=43782 RepID=A0AAE0ALV8_9ROSI|nr:hypothetical protein Dsin_014408 [Dipteronia sinensis]